MRPSHFVAFVLAFGAAVLGHAAPQTLTLDVEKTSVSFTLGGTLHEVHGTLHETQGQIVFDLETGEASGQVVIDARRTETGNAKRDAKMHAEVLEDDRYPEIVFTAQRIEGSLAESGSSRIVLHGVVGIHGGEHPVTLAAEVSREGDRVSAQCSFPVPFVKWGMKDPSVFILRTDKHVDVTLDVHGSLN